MISATVVEWLGQECGISIDPHSVRPVSGGCMHESVLVNRLDTGSVFLKQNDADQRPVLEAEKASLELLKNSATIRVPRPIAVGEVGGRACFAMEGLTLKRPAGTASEAELGVKLAKLHKTPSPNGKFGAPFDNYIGATPQPNGWRESWANFFVIERLVAQFRLAEKRGRKWENEERACEAIHAYLSTLNVTPRLLHGDLWNGNVGFLEDGEPVIFDPASYFGDPETDIAFTQMFGGFSPAFYEAYRATHHAPEPVRTSIYNLYHLLNHWNLFGGNYGNSAEDSIREILRQIS
ncbi:MAG: fructosamine kinase family protein [Verrucomicrobiales bacterium]|nr:fructosamine kinase family protein [Verrucomicrobiales bacterium]